jgi:hypothetical protein
VHLSWNGPYYERHGFVIVAAERCGEQLRDELSFERRLLPDPEHRVVMRRELTAEVIFPSDNHTTPSLTLRPFV